MEWIVGIIGAGIAVVVIKWLWKRLEGHIMATPEQSKVYGEIDDDLRDRGI